MPDQADFHEFMNLRRAKRHSAETNAASEPPVARPVPNDWWLDTWALPRHRRESDRANRLVAYGLIGLAMAVYVGISWAFGWGVFR